MVVLAEPVEEMMTLPTVAAAAALVAVVLTREQIPEEMQQLTINWSLLQEVQVVAAVELIVTAA